MYGLKSRQGLVLLGRQCLHHNRQLWAALPRICNVKTDCVPLTESIQCPPSFACSQDMYRDTVVASKLLVQPRSRILAEHTGKQAPDKPRYCPLNVALPSEGEGRVHWQACA